MKKTFYIFISLILFFALISIPVASRAAALSTVDTELSSSKIAPGEQVTLTVNFGTSLGGYTVKAAYDNSIFDYVSSEGGTANDAGDKVILVFHDSTGGTNPRTTASITFKAKDNLESSNPTNFAVTLEGMISPDGSVTYDDIGTPIEEDILVEPNYVDYTLRLEHAEVVKKETENAMKLITESSMGRNYEHVRMLARVTAKPTEDSSVKLLATQDGTEVDLIQSGWGDETDGYSIGGKNVKQEILLNGQFSNDGAYTIKFTLVDRHDSDSVIAEKSFNITVGEKQVTQTPSTEEQLPATHPKTGNTSYVFIGVAIFSLVVIYFVLSKNNKKH